MRVLHVGKFYAPEPGGMETHLQVLCEELSATMDVRVLVAARGRKTQRATYNGIPVTRAATAVAIAGASFCPSMPAEIRAAEPDVVHLHLPNPPAALAYLMSGHRGPLVVTYHSDIVRQRVLGRAIEPLVRRVLRRASAIIVSSEALIDASPVLRAVRDKCRVVPFGTRLEPFERRDEGAIAGIRARHGTPLVVGVGRLVGYKGFEFLIDAMRAVRGSLVIIGEGPLHSELTERIRRHGLEDRVVLAGHVADVTSHLQAADVFVLSSISRNEAFGIVQIEALACGTPVINTRLDSGVPTVSLDGQTGITVAPCDAAALAKAIDRVLTNSELRASYSMAALARARTQFSSDIMTHKTLRIYGDVLGTPLVPVDEMRTSVAAGTF
ncbi:MAG TPA: glycosyltransferase [Gemmatimonadaceae bacterium]|nr:glycosyltransferase [Gemmatimonadaceae bacterium]